MREWFRTDIGPHFLDCLSFSVRQISLIDSNVREWPWTILGLAAITQAACALYLDERDSMGVQVLSDKCRKTTIEALQYQSGKTVPKPFMAGPKVLLERVQNQSVKLHLSEQAEKDLEYLRGFRNQFTHLIPKGWSIQIRGLPRISKSAFDLVLNILDEPGLYQRITDAERKNAVAMCYEGIRQCVSLERASQPKAMNKNKIEGEK